MLTLSLMLTLTVCPQAPQPSTTPQFEAPVRLKAADGYVKVEAPGYAAPCWHDVDGDGHHDLIVGQFADGKMRVFRGDGHGKLQAGSWLQAEGKVAVVPGVW